jgi:hypothetical protein
VNTTNQSLSIFNVTLKKSYQVHPQEEIILITDSVPSHFLIYAHNNENTDNQKNQFPLFSFGTKESLHASETHIITTEHLTQSSLPENIYLIPSSIKLPQAINLVTKPIKQCSRCEERRKARAAAKAML